MNRKTAVSERDNTIGRFSRYVQHERENGIHPAIRLLHSRARNSEETANGRAVQYARIERGYTA